MARRCVKQAGASRAKHHKSRRACQTCRTRRIRCDETSPRCRNCEASGRICDGVAVTKFTFVDIPRSRKSSPVVTILLQPGLSPNQHADDERRSFDFFVSNVAPLFSSGAVDSPFWKTLVPQLSKVHPTVWDAAISIALLFEHPLSLHHGGETDSNHTLTAHQLKALKWYSRAVSRVNRQLDLGPEDEASALLTCALFTSVEFQQGNARKAMSLLDKGFKLLLSYLQSPSACQRSAQSRGIAEVVVPFFSRHAMFKAAFGLPLLSGWPHIAAAGTNVDLEYSTPASIDSLKAELRDLAYRGHDVIRSALLILHDRREISRMRMLSRQQAVLAQLTHWRCRLSSLETQQTPEATWTSSNLLMCFLVTYIWVSTCLSPEQTSFDAFNSLFAHIVHQASAALAARSFMPLALTPRRPDTFDFERGCISPLYFTATKCRDPGIRRHALSLIRHAPEHNTIFSCIPTEMILKKMIAFEENTTHFSSTPPSSLLPPEHRRVHHLQILAPSTSIRLLTYAAGHPSDPRYLQDHIVSLADSNDGTSQPSASDRQTSKAERLQYCRNAKYPLTPTGLSGCAPLSGICPEMKN